MFECFFDDTLNFNSFSIEHALIIISSAFFGWIIINFALKKDLKTQNKIAIWLSLIPLISVLARMFYLAVLGKFSYQEDLPLHICRLLALALPIAMYYKFPKWFGVLYFCIIVGTFNAILTPDLNKGLPHIDSLLYWSLHSFLVIGALYFVIVFKFRPNWRDFFRAVIVTNIYMVCMHLTNLMIGSNYFFTRYKPEGASILDFFGEWPLYLFVTEAIGIVLFVIALLPFILKAQPGSVSPRPSKFES